ncbi:MAG: alkaline shock response membrane anchor protein AmaP [Sporichthyaceae bacterium]|nr:alkaline shock response membrane anchor protein AmaP [Sporichthyaceae bacterium]
MTPSARIRRTARTDRQNPLGLLIVGALLLAAGVAALATSFGAFGDAAAEAPILPEGVQRFGRENTGWLRIILLLAGLLLFFMALRWLLAQLRIERLGEVLLEPDDRRGQTTMSPAALTDAVEGEAQTVHGVNAVKARLVHDPQHPDLHMLVDLGPRANLREVRDAIENNVVQHAREALSREELPTLVQYRLARGTAQRAR